MNNMLIRSEKIATSITGAVAYRVLYNSYDLQDKPTTSSGLVVTPLIAEDNHKVLTWAHGTTGIGDAGCPSAKDDPARELETYFQSGSTTDYDYGIPGLQEFIDEGWIVLATDYQGLGTEGIHQYTINRTNALDAINIVHAAKEMNIGVGNKIAVMGWSQGGGTAAAAVELDIKDYRDLTIVGSVAMSPGVPAMAVKVPGLGDALKGGQIPNDPHLIMQLAALTVAFPETLSMDDVFTPLGKKIFEENWNIQPVHHLGDIFERNSKLHGPMMAINKDKLPQWMEGFVKSSAAQVKPIAPVLVLTDGIDGPCPIPWQDAYIAAIKDLGGDISQSIYPQDDHFSLPQASVNEARKWLDAKF